MTPRARLLAYGFCGLLVILGVVGPVALSGLFGELLAFILISLGLVFALGLVFYEVGLSEDREREREQKARAEAKARPAPAARPRPRLERMRGRSRRLKGG